MTGTATIDQTIAEAIAGRHGFKAEVRRQCGDCWDVRIYGNGGGYDRRRDVSSANIPSQILRMVAAKVAGLTYEQAATLTDERVMDILNDVFVDQAYARYVEAQQYRCFDDSEPPVMTREQWLRKLYY